MSSIVLPACCKCHKPYHIENDLLSLQQTLRPLYGDTFFQYTCSRCTHTKPTFERLPMSWLAVIQIVLYHLHKTDRRNMGYFRWKEDICQLIEDRWEQLCPAKSKTASWMNSVSSVLSANGDIFESGFELLKQPGWWALKKIEAPRPPLQLPMENGRRKRSRSVMMAVKPWAETKGEEDELVDVGQEDSPPKTVPLAHPMPQKASLIVPPPTAPSKDEESCQQAAASSAQTHARSPSTVETAQTLLFAKHFADRVPNVNALLPLEREATPTTMKAAQEIKRKLVERLLKVDSRLLQEALATQSATGYAPPISTASQQHSKPLGAVPLALKPFPGDGSSSSTNPPHLPFDMALNGPKIAKSIKELRRLQKAHKPANYIRASPHENELLERCIRVMDPDPLLQRFRRKLVMRRGKRRLGLAIFDIDVFMYKYLKTLEPLRLAPISTDDGVSGERDSRSETVAAVADDLHIDVVRDDAPRTFFNVPFHRDPSLSFAAKLNGLSNTLPIYPPETVSPFSGLRLPSFLHREHQIKPLRMRLLEELEHSFPRYDPDDDDGLQEQEEIENDPDLTVNPKATPSTGATRSIDFIHVRKEWIPQVNRLLRQFFWPSIDMTESLDYPDYGILVMYRKLVIGCVFMTPDGYVTYFMIHPEWSGAGLGSLLLYLLLSKVAPCHRDVTLHVSVTNPALILYQKFGFKPEEFIVNFYDKYYRDEVGCAPSLQSTYSKNAFFIRFRR